MAIIDNCTLWCRQESNLSDIGPNGIVTGAPGRVAAKFNNGLDGDDNNYVKFTGAVATPVFLYETWWEPDSASTVGGLYSGFIHVYNAATNDYMTLWSNWTANTLTFRIIASDGGANKTDYRYNAAFTKAQHHIMLVVNSAAGAGRRHDLYLDTVLLVPNAIANDQAFVFTGPMDTYIGGNGQAAHKSKSILDNTKIYNNLALPDLADILANWQNEGWPVTGGVRMIDGGLLRTPMIGGSVLIH